MNRREYLTMTARQLAGRKARTLIKITTKGGLTVKRGTIVTITGKAGGLEIEVPECKHCGQSFFCRKVSPFDVELLPVDAQPSDS